MALRLEDRLRIALGAGMGVKLLPADVETVCRFIVVLRQFQNTPGLARQFKVLADGALKKLEG